MMIINYALQTHDASDRETHMPRYATLDRSEITEKCVTSFMYEIENFTKQSPSDVRHVINIFDDHSSDKTISFLDRIVDRFSNDKIEVTVTNLVDKGIANSIKNCYDWLSKAEGDLVYQVQDDYLFLPDSILEITDVFYKVKNDIGVEPLITTYNDPMFWNSDNCYRYRVTPRTLVPGARRYWINTLNVPCTFFSSKEQFNAHWDMYDIFFNILNNPPYNVLESVSLDRITTEKNIMALVPVTSVALHMQSIGFQDPYIDWKHVWDNVVKV